MSVVEIAGFEPARATVFPYRASFLIVLHGARLNVPRVLFYGFVQVYCPTGERALLWTVYSALLVYAFVSTIYRRKGIAQKLRAHPPAMCEGHFGENVIGSPCVPMKCGAIPVTRHEL